MTSPGNYPSLQSAGLAVIPPEHQTLLSAGLREKERGSGSGSGPYPNWPYRATIRITNPVNITDYQHKLILPWKPGMQFDFRDIRFAQQDGKICPYWIESYTQKTNATVWIKVPSASQRQIYLYYGNSQAISENNGNNVFIDFDDFEGATPSGWTLEAGQQNKYAHSTTKSFSGNQSMKLYPGKNENVCIYRSESSVNIIGGFFYDLGSGSQLAFLSNVFYGDASIRFVGIRPDQSTTKYCYGTWGSPVVSTKNRSEGWHKLEIRFDGSGGIAYYVDSTLLGSQSGTGINNTQKLEVSELQDNVVTYFDCVYVRKYTATEPTLSLRQYGPRPDCQIIYYPFLPEPLKITVLKYDELIEFSQTMTAETPIVSLGPVIEFSQKTVASKPITNYFEAPIVPIQTQIVKVFAKLYMDLSLVRTKSIMISRSIDDTMWRANIELHQYKNLDTTVLRHCTYAATDHLGVSHTIFTGILPGSQPQLAPADNTTRITGYDYAWYLSQRKVPEAYLHNTAAPNPANIIRGLLGGDDWLTETGIEPYSIQPVAEWGTTLNTRVFDFDRSTSRLQAIQKICDYCRYIFIVKWRNIGGVMTPCAYFCGEDQIDTYLDLPSPVTFTKPDPYVVEPITWDVKGDERYNRVTVFGRDPTSGTTISYTAETTDVTNGDEIPVEFVESSGAFTTAAQVQARAQELLTYFSTTQKTYTVTLNQRVDLELIQKVTFSGWSEIPATPMRIISITYMIDDATATKKVQIQVTSETKLSQIRRMYRGMNPDPLSEADALFDAKAAAMPGNEVGTVTEINDDGTATVLLEDGRTVTARII